VSVYLAVGVAVFAHECEAHRHSVTVGWSPGYPALDERSLAPCPSCGAAYERVAACTGNRVALRDEAGGIIEAGDHECHPISGHVTRSDDHTLGLVPDPEPDPAELRRQRLELVRWVIGQQQVIAQTAALLERNEFPSEWHREDCQLTHDLALEQLEARGVDPAG
jgi:hypothetical protein